MSLTEAQMEFRRTRITATDVAPILGLSRWRSPADVLADKLYPSAWGGNRRTKWGNRAEAAILDGYEEDHGVKLVRAAELGTLCHPDEHWAAASPDALLGTSDKWERVVECKVVGSRMAWLWGQEGSDDVPPHVVAQVAWQQWITNCDLAHVAAVIDGEERLYVLKRDPELEDQIVATCHSWHLRHLINREELTPDGSEGFSSYLRARYPRNDERIITATPDVEELVEAYRKARLAAEEAELVQSRLKQALEKCIGDAAALEGTFGRITWRRSKDSESLDKDALLKHLAPQEDVLAQFKKTRPGVRRFTVPRGWSAKGGE